MINNLSQRLLILAIMLISLQSKCNCNNASSQPQSPSYGDLQLVPVGDTTLKRNRKINLRIETKGADMASIDPSKLELHFWCMSGPGSELLYNNRPVKDKLSGADLPPLGQTLSFQLNPGNNGFVGVNFSLHYAGKLIQGLLQFTWKDEDDPQGEAFLRAMSTQWNRPTIKKLIEDNQQYVNYQNKIGNSPMHRIVEEKHVDVTQKIEIIKTLLENGADINMINNAGYSPLVQSIIYAKNKELAEFLLDHDANVNQPDNQRCSPLYWAISSRNEEMAKVLLKHQADVNQPDKDGKSPLYLAAQLGNVELVDLLLRHNTEVNQVDKDRFTPLYKAITNGNEEVIKMKMLIAAKAAVDWSTDIQGWVGNRTITPLGLAIQLKKPSIIQLLLDAGADVKKATDDAKFTSLHAAVSTKDIAIVQLLLANDKAKELINQDENRSQTTPLLYAVHQNSKDIVQLLLDNGAKESINQPSNHRITPLWKAVATDNQAIVKLLLDNGAKDSINKADEDGRTPLQLAQEKRFAEIEALLQAKINT